MRVRTGAGLWWRWAVSLAVAALAFMAMVALLGWLKPPVSPRARAASPPLAVLAAPPGIGEHLSASPPAPGPPSAGTHESSHEIFPASLAV